MDHMMFIIQYALREIKNKTPLQIIFRGQLSLPNNIWHWFWHIFFRQNLFSPTRVEFVSGLKVFSYRLAVRHRGQACVSGTVQVAAGLWGLACHSGASCGHKATAAELVSTRHTQKDSQTWYILCNGRPEKEVTCERRTGTLQEETANCQWNISTLLLKKSLTFSRGKGISTHCALCQNQTWQLKSILHKDPIISRRYEWVHDGLII